MTPELKESLERLAQWHDVRAVEFGSKAAAAMPEHLRESARALRGFHIGAAADIRAAIVSVEDDMRNRLVHQMIKADRRKFDDAPATPSAFGGL